MSALLASNSVHSKTFEELNGASDKHVDDDDDDQVAGTPKDPKVASPANRTDTAFYDGKISNTDVKPKKVSRDINESPMTEKQLSEASPNEF